MGRSVKKKMELTTKPAKAYVSASALCDLQWRKTLGCDRFWLCFCCLPIPDMTKQEESSRSRIKRAGESFTRGHCTQA